MDQCKPLINGRAAMIGWMAALAAEVNDNQPLFKQAGWSLRTITRPTRRCVPTNRVRASV